nr:uncharacterized protein LOC129383923 [Dermacentor andersoni]
MCVRATKSVMALSSKDLWGVLRGSCNEPFCDCRRNIVVCSSDDSAENSSRCDYCNHCPGAHGRITDLESKILEWPKYPNRAHSQVARKLCIEVELKFKCKIGDLEEKLQGNSRSVLMQRATCVHIHRHLQASNHALINEILAVATLSYAEVFTWAQLSPEPAAPPLNYSDVVPSP